MKSSAVRTIAIIIAVGGLMGLAMFESIKQSNAQSYHTVERKMFRDQSSVASTGIDIVCIEGHKFVILNNNDIEQMFEIGSGSYALIPIECE